MASSLSYSTRENNTTSDTATSSKRRGENDSTGRTSLLDSFHTQVRHSLLNVLQASFKQYTEQCTELQALLADLGGTGQHGKSSKGGALASISKQQSQELSQLKAEVNALEAQCDYLTEPVFTESDHSDRRSRQNIRDTSMHNEESDEEISKTLRNAFPHRVGSDTGRYGSGFRSINSPSSIFEQSKKSDDKGYKALGDTLIFAPRSSTHVSISHKEHTLGTSPDSSIASSLYSTNSLGDTGRHSSLSTSATHTTTSTTSFEMESLDLFDDDTDLTELL